MHFAKRTKLTGYRIWSKLFHSFIYLFSLYNKFKIIKQHFPPVITALKTLSLRPPEPQATRIMIRNKKTAL